MLLHQLLPHLQPGTISERATTTATAAAAAAALQSLLSNATGEQALAVASVTAAATIATFDVPKDEDDGWHSWHSSELNVGTPTHHATETFVEEKITNGGTSLHAASFSEAPECEHPACEQGERSCSAMQPSLRRSKTILKMAPVNGQKQVAVFHRPKSELILELIAAASNGQEQFADVDTPLHAAASNGIFVDNEYGIDTSSSALIEASKLAFVDSAAANGIDTTCIAKALIEASKLEGDTDGVGHEMRDSFSFIAAIPAPSGDSLGFDGHTPVHAAAPNGIANGIDTTCSAKALIEASKLEGDGNTPVHAAAPHGIDTTCSAKALIEASTLEGDGNTPVHAAAPKGIDTTCSDKEANIEATKLHAFVDVAAAKGIDTSCSAKALIEALTGGCSKSGGGSLEIADGGTPRFAAAPVTAEYAEYAEYLIEAQKIDAEFDSTVVGKALIEAQSCEKIADGGTPDHRKKKKKKKASIQLKEEPSVHHETPCNIEDMHLTVASLLKFLVDAGHAKVALEALAKAEIQSAQHQLTPVQTEACILQSLSEIVDKLIPDQHDLSLASQE